jgi:hypothetical protein
MTILPDEQESFLHLALLFSLPSGLQRESGDAGEWSTCERVAYRVRASRFASCGSAVGTSRTCNRNSRRGPFVCLWRPGGACARSEKRYLACEVTAICRRELCPAAAVPLTMIGQGQQHEPLTIFLSFFSPFPLLVIRDRVRYFVPSIVVGNPR